MTLDTSWRTGLRALRRHLRLRVIARAEHLLRASGDGESQARRRALLNHDHMASCSCSMCGNPRRFFGERTVQERRRVEADRSERTRDED